MGVGGTRGRKKGRERGWGVTERGDGEGGRGGRGDREGGRGVHEGAGWT